MLLNYKVKNFRSIRDELEISMEADMALKDTVQYPGVFESGKNKVLKAFGIFGANASGKSSIIMSFLYLRNFIMLSPNYTGASSIDTLPFKFCSDYEKRPTEYEIKFEYCGITYFYSISFIKNRILTESLYYCPQGRKTFVFRRKDNDVEISSSQISASMDEFIRKSIISVKPVITLASQFNIPVLQIPFDFFSKDMLCINGLADCNSFGVGTLLATDQGYSEFAKSLSEGADLGIDSFSTKKVRLNGPILPMNGIGSDFKGNSFVDAYKVITVHHSGGKAFELGLEEESLGTNKLLMISGPLYNALNNGSVLVMDEFGSSMHPDISKFILTLFMNPSINQKGAQFIFATQESKILNDVILRRDEMAFASKDSQGNTSVTPLSFFSARKAENYESGYLNGRYVPSPDVTDYKIKL